MLWRCSPGTLGAVDEWSALCMEMMAPDCMLHDCKHPVGEPMPWVPPGAMALENGHIPCWSLGATVGLLQKHIEGCASWPPK